MEGYKTRASRISGTSYSDIYDLAFGHYQQIKRRTKRRPYIRSAYFNKEKIFLGLFWQHLHQKNWRDRTRRIRYFPAAIEVLQNSRYTPSSLQNPFTSSEILHRFVGVTADGYSFYVQIKEDKRSGNKFLLSIFPDQQSE